MLKEALPVGGAERQLALIVKYLPPHWDRRVWAMGGGPFADAIRSIWTFEITFAYFPAP